MSEKLTLRQRIFGGASEDGKQSFATVTAEDGTVLNYEGDLVKDTAVMVDVDGTMMPAPEGTYSLTGEGMENVAIVVDANGIITEVLEVPAEATTEEIVEAIVEEMKAQKVEMNAIKKENAELKLKVAEFGNKPAVEPKKKPIAKKGIEGIPSNPMLNKILNN